MGVVYQAEDTTLKRTVALKFLLSQSVGAGEEKERFLREAQAAAALNHPNIATVYEIGEHDGETFIAMECVGGESLKDRIEQGPLKIGEAIELGCQISTGLHAAHEKGIAHRDVKTANIMLTEDGQAKITDFGLAKLGGRSLMTQAGTTLGTAAYMSPEQARGEGVDHRTDIWSLGVVLYEMISGRLPFVGDYEQAVTYSILNEAPEPLTGLRTGVPMELERVVNKLLAKDASVRYQHADEVGVDLRGIDLSEAGRSHVSVAQVPVVKKARFAGWRQVIPWTIAVLISVGGLVIGWSLRGSQLSAPAPVVRFSGSYC